MSVKEIISVAVLSIVFYPILYYFFYRPLKLRYLELEKINEGKDKDNQTLCKQIGRLQEMEHLYKSLMETIPDIVYKIDLDGNFTFINSAVKTLGYNPNELIGRHFSTIITSEEIEYISRSAVLPKYIGKFVGEDNSPKLFDERRTGKRSTHGLEVHIINKAVPDSCKAADSETIIGEINSSGVYRFDSNSGESELIGSCGIIKTNEYSGSSGVIRDITKRKHEVDSLVRLKQMMEDITQGVSDSMSLMTEDYRILWANKATEENTGYKIDELVGRHCYEVTHFLDKPCDSPQHPCPLKEIMDTGRPTTMLHKHFDKNGMPRYVEVTVYNINENDGGVKRYIYVSKDVTAKKKMEEELYALNNLLEERVREETRLKIEKEQLLIQQSKMASLGEMINSITHQWKQPLNAISATVMEITEAYNFGELNITYVNRLNDTIIQQIQFMAKTMDDFRNFLRPSKEKIFFDVKNAVEEIIIMFSPLFKKNNILMRLNCVEEGVFDVSGYPNEFKQVILNLINNSRDAIVSKSKIEDDTGKADYIDINIFNDIDKLIISISDNGGGIQEDVIDRIFEPYFTTKPLDEGTGIGLYIAKTIIEDNMGWKLTARNVKGGAEFRIEIMSPADVVVPAAQRGDRVSPQTPPIAEV